MDLDDRGVHDAPGQVDPTCSRPKPSSWQRHTVTRGLVSLLIPVPR